MLRPTTLSIDSDIINRIDRDRGDIPRSRYIVRLLESSLKNDSKFMKEKVTNLPVDNNSFEAKNQQGSSFNGVD